MDYIVPTTITLNRLKNRTVEIGGEMAGTGGGCGHIVGINNETTIDNGLTIDDESAA